MLKQIGGFNPSEKYARQIGFIFSKDRGENKKKYLSCHHLEFPGSQSFSFKSIAPNFG